MESVDSLSVFFNDDAGDEGEMPVSSSEKIWTKNDILKLLGKESNQIELVEIIAKSEIYNKFKQVKIDDKLVDFVACNNCKTVYTWTKATGNKSLHRHDCNENTAKRGNNKPVSSTIDKYVRKNVPEAGINKLNKSITFGLVKDLRPLYSVERSGFKHMAQALINFGAKYGCQDVENCIQHRTTLKRYHVPDLCKEARQNYKELFKSTTSNKFAFSKDMWSEKYNQRNFLSLTMHFINDNWELLPITLGLDEIVEKKTTEHLRAKCEEILKLYFEAERVPHVMAESFSVTDGGSNMLNLFLNQHPCQCHKINCFVDWTLNTKPLGKRDQRKLEKGLPVDQKKLFNLERDCPTIDKSITGIKELVTYYKRTALNSKLPTSLKQDVPTRWDSELYMLESYVAVKADVEVMLLERREFERLANIDNGIVDELIKFFIPIRKCSSILSGDKYPTIHLVAVEFSKLKLAIMVNETDSSEIKVLKNQAAICFEEYLDTSIFLCMACILHPK